MFLNSNEELKQYIDPDAIPERYGGTSKYVRRGQSSAVVMMH